MFGIGVFGRLVSAYFLNKKSEGGRVEDGEYYRYKSILQDKTKIIFIIYNTAIHFAVMFLGPLFVLSSPNDREFTLFEPNTSIVIFFKEWVHSS